MLKGKTIPQSEYHIDIIRRWISSMSMDDLGGFDISLSGILSGLIFGVIGMWLFREGKRNTNFQVLIIGLALMIYPYFTRGPVGDWGVGTILCGLAYYFW